jgi:PhzF family phenazine biosynthesis protein
MTAAAIYQLDAFTSDRFAGNPAAVVVLDRFLPDEVMQAVAAENNLAETAFLVADGPDYLIRWFTPIVEVPLCGHATLASAAVVMERLEPGRSEVTFHSASGPLPVVRTESGYTLDFPARPSEQVAPPAGLADALGADPLEVTANEHNYLAVLEHEQLVRTLTPDVAGVARLDRYGVIVTAPGSEPYDFVSRYFAPAKGISEDPVTGGAHCTLAPYWASRLGKRDLFAFQASARGGEIRCRVVGERVELTGTCVSYLAGQIEI